MPVGAGIAIDGCAHGSRNSRERLESLQAMGDGEIDQALEDSAGVGMDAMIGGHQAIGPVAEDDAGRTPGPTNKVVGVAGEEWA